MKKLSLIALVLLLFQVLGYTDGEYQYQAWADNDYKNSVLFFTEEDFGLAYDDYVLVSGTVLYMRGASNAFGGTLKLPVIEADSVEKADITVFNPSLKTIEIGEMQEQSNIQVTLEKVEIAEKSTRVYLNLLNNSGDGLSIYSFNSYIIQGTAQYDSALSAYNDSAFEEEALKYDMVSGTEQSGVLAFEPIDLEGGSFTVSIYISSNDWSNHLDNFEFTVEM